MIKCLTKNIGVTNAVGNRESIPGAEQLTFIYSNVANRRHVVTVHSVTSNALRDAQKTNLLVTSTRSSVCCANLILGFSVNFVHKKHLAECYQ